MIPPSPPERPDSVVLPIGATIVSALGEGRATLLHLYRTLLVWLVVLLALGWVAGPERVALVREGFAEADAATIPTDATGWAALAASWLLTLMLPPLVAVAAHRSFLLGEQRRTWLGPLRRETLRYVWRFFVVTVLASLQTLLIAGPVMALLLWLTLSGQSTETGSPLDGSRAVTIGQMIGIAIALVWTLFFCRFAPWLPAAAVGDRSVTLRGAWRSTRGRGLRSLVVVIGTVLPFILVLPTTEILLLEGLTLTPWNGPQGRMWVQLVMMWLEPLVFGAFLAASLSAIYRAANGIPLGARLQSAGPSPSVADPGLSAVPWSR